MKFMKLSTVQYSPPISTNSYYEAVLSIDVK